MDTPRKQPLSVLQPNAKVEQFRAQPAPAPSSFQPHAQRPSAADCSDQPAVLEAQIVAAIRTIYDPEIPVNIYDLGLIYDITIAPDNAVTIRMTLTAPGCPVAGALVEQVENKVQAVPAVASAKVDLVFDPPWTRDMMSEAVKLQLGLM